MLYLLDANVLIDANRDYYPIARIPEFWEWLQHHGTQDNVKLPRDMFEEITGGDDDLGLWAKRTEIKAAILLEEEVDVAIVRHVVDRGYASNLSDDEVEKLGRDPFLIAYALAAPGNRCVVTTEKRKPSRQRANRHIPDVCNDLEIPCVDTFEFARTMNFSTQWRSR